MGRLSLIPNSVLTLTSMLTALVNRLKQNWTGVMI